MYPKTGEQNQFPVQLESNGTCTSVGNWQRLSCQEKYNLHWSFLYFLEMFPAYFSNMYYMYMFVEKKEQKYFLVYLVQHLYFEGFNKFNDVGKPHTKLHPQYIYRSQVWIYITSLSI